MNLKKYHLSEQIQSEYNLLKEKFETLNKQLQELNNK